MFGNFNNMVVSFRGSILGFEELDRFVVETIEGTPFAYLKSLESPEISFLTTSPFQWRQDYTLQLEEPNKKKLLLENPEDVLVMCIVTINKSLESSTINLIGPL